MLAEKQIISVWQEIGAAFSDHLVGFCCCLTCCPAVNIVTDGSVKDLGSTALPLHRDVILLLIV